MAHVYYNSQDVTGFPISIERGAGGIISNTENLVKWLQGLFNGKILSEKALNKMTSVVCEDDEGVGVCASINAQGEKTSYQPGDSLPNNQLTNNGYSSGFSTAIYPDINKGEFIWLSNGADPVGYQSQTVYFKNSKMIFALMENQKPEAGHELDIENFIFDVKNYLKSKK